MFAWYFQRIAAASSGTTTTLEGSGTLSQRGEQRSGCRTRSRSWLATADRRTADEGMVMVQICAGRVIRTLTPAIALLAALHIGTGALAQEIKLTRPAQSGVESLLANE